jgi:hypothetical protein
VLKLCAALALYLLLIKPTAVNPQLE